MSDDQVEACPRCRNKNLEVLAWVHIKTRKWTDKGPKGYINTWCGECQEYLEGEPIYVVPVPPDPEEMNDARADWAESALLDFQTSTGCDSVFEALPDLLCDLMHWCDRKEGENFDAALERAQSHYQEETKAFEGDK